MEGKPQAAGTRWSLISERQGSCEQVAAVSEDDGGAGGGGAGGRVGRGAGARGQLAAPVTGGGRAVRTEGVTAGEEISAAAARSIQGWRERSTAGL